MYQELHYAVILPAPCSLSSLPYPASQIFLEIENVESPPDIGIFKMCAERILLDIEDNIININSGIVENSFIFDADVIVRPDEKINFKLKKDTTIKLFFLGEFYTP